MLQRNSAKHLEEETASHGQTMADHAQGAHLDFDTQVKLHLYESIARDAHVPTAHEVASAMRVSLTEVQAAFSNLRKKKLLVPEPNDSTRIRMAPPFSGIATAFRVRVQDKFYYANCSWDALGIPAALHEDAIIEAEDGYSHEPIMLEVKHGEPVSAQCVFHFAVPAAKWWDDIIYT